MLTLLPESVWSNWHIIRSDGICVLRVVLMSTVCKRSWRYWCYPLLVEVWRSESRQKMKRCYSVPSSVAKITRRVIKQNWMKVDELVQYENADPVRDKNEGMGIKRMLAGLGS